MFLHAKGLFYCQLQLLALSFEPRLFSLDFFKFAPLKLPISSSCLQFTHECTNSSLDYFDFISVDLWNIICDKQNMLICVSCLCVRTWRLYDWEKEYNFCSKFTSCSITHTLPPIHWCPFVEAFSCVHVYYRPYPVNSDCLKCCPERWVLRNCEWAVFCINLRLPDDVMIVWWIAVLQ